MVNADSRHVVLVSGGRVGCNFRMIKHALNWCMHLWPLRRTILVHGGAEGTDDYCGKVAAAAHHHVLPVKINKELDGHDTHKAPRNRNKRMAELNPNQVIIFPGGPGTRHMYDVAFERGLAILEVEPDNELTYKIWRVQKYYDTSLVYTGVLSSL